ncbi:MAG: hypothetical protein JSW11_07815 [Candidatus Heimdallarchaeota archaeon]|nr:MAG: hypothetical protein JSW11_07815 [Candidatus Heimdallarchaeota archaeon]
MSGEFELRALITTRSTLIRFTLIGIIIAIVGLFVLWFLIPFIGLMLLWFGFAISALSLISLLFLWLSERLLPKPKR